jgi:hypothetical protein
LATLGSDTFGTSTGAAFVSAGITRGSDAGVGAADSDTFEAGAVLGVAGDAAGEDAAGDDATAGDGVLAAPIDAGAAAETASVVFALVGPLVGPIAPVELIEPDRPDEADELDDSTALRRLVEATAGALVAGATGVTAAAAREERDEACVDASFARCSGTGAVTAGVDTLADGAGGVTEAAACVVVVVPGESVVVPEAMLVSALPFAVVADGEAGATAAGDAAGAVTSLAPLAVHCVIRGITCSGSNITNDPAATAATAMMTAVPSAEDDRAAGAVVDADAPRR